MRAWTLAKRDLKGGRAGLGLLFACLLLSIAGLAAVLSLVTSMERAIDANGRALLGGDLLVSQAQRPATAAELDAMRALGTVSSGISTRAMVRVGEEVALVDLRGMDAAFPLAGTIELDGRRPAAADEIAIGTEAASRLDLGPGARLRLGNRDYRVTGIIERMPGGTFLFAPPALLTAEGLAASGIVAPGSLVEYQYRIAFDVERDLGAAEEEIEAALEPIGWETRTREGASGGTRRFVSSTGDMLLFIAIAALGIGALGIGAAVRAFAASRRAIVARLKLLGARRSVLAKMLGLELVAVILAALVPALLLGALAPVVVGDVLGERLPIRPEPGPHLLPMALAACVALSVTLMMAWRPLAAALRTPPKALLRAEAGLEGGASRRLDWLVPALAALLSIALLLVGASNPRLAALALAGLAVLALMFWMMGWGIERLARSGSGRGGPIVRLGIAALHRPANATRALTVALGLGLSILVALAATSQSILGELDGAIPARAPSHFITDIPRGEEARLRTLVGEAIPAADVRVVPSLRGAITRVDGIAVADLPEERRSWLTRGDRGLTWSASLPEGNRITAGEWWDADYAGPPLVSLEDEAARDLALGVGDTLTLTVAGRDITATVASLRAVDWQSYGFNFGIVFAPGTLEQAPHMLMATIEPGEADVPRGFDARLAEAFPTASAIAVAGVIDDVRSVLTALEAAVSIATVLAILIGVVVLTGSVLSTRASRARDLVLLRLVGARQKQLLASQLIEFAVLSVAATAVAILVGLLLARLAVVELFDFAFAPSAPEIVMLAVGTVVVAIASALVAVRPALARSPAQALRTR